MLIKQRRLARKLAEVRPFASEFNLQANERTSARFRKAEKSGKKVVHLKKISSYTVKPVTESLSSYELMTGQ